MIKHLYKTVILTSLLIFSVALSAQHTVTGTVMDEDTQTTIPGATVLEEGTSNGTITDINGTYSLTVSSEQATLIFSYVGFESLKIPLNGRAVVDVVMKTAFSELDEVVVIGYGTQKKKVVTGAISSVGAEEIESIPILRAEQAMQGRTAGVQVTQQSGQPGERPTVRIRGAGTTGNADPLYIVDGMAVGGIDYLNPGDIESIDVLKDAASAAIYGARAANGVVLITTKTGEKGKMNLTYSGYYGIQNVSKTVDMLNADQYRELMNEGARNAGQSEPFDLNEVAPFNTNWQDILFQSNVPIMNHEISVTGGNERSSYASSLSYFSQQGIIGAEKSQFERITARINSRHQVNDWFNFGNNLSYSNIVRRGIESNQSFNGAYSGALNMDPLTPLYQEDTAKLSQYPYTGEPVVRDAYGNVYAISEYVQEAEVLNPMALLETQNGEERIDKVVGNIFGEAEIIEGLKIRSSLGIDLAYGTHGSFRPLFYLNGAQNNVQKTSVEKTMERWFTWQWENTLSYSKTIKDHTFSVLIGTTASEHNWEDLYGFNAKVPTTDPANVYLNLATDTVWVASGGALHASLFSQFGRITYDYKGRYAFTGIIRRDGSSKFGPNNRYGTFPSVGVTWLLTEEPFMPDLGPVNYIKLRASWGVNGNQEIGNYQFVSTIDKSRGYIFGPGRLVGASPEFIENSDIQWEESEQLDIALDLGFFEDKLVATLDYYVKTTNGLLERIPIPAHVGNDPPYANVGSVQNRGVEMSFNWREFVSNDLKYSFGLNAAYNKNKMTKIGNEDKFIAGATWAIAGTVTAAEEGLPIGFFWGYQTDGLFQNISEVYQHIGTEGALLQPNAKPGDVRFVDVNGDNAIDGKDRVMIGSPIPDWTLGVNGSVNFKQFDVSFLMTGAFGHQIFNGTQRQDLQYTNRTTKILDRWTGEGTSNEIPRYTWSDLNNNYRVSDLYIENGSYMRLKNIQVGYTLPNSVLDRIGASTWRFYVSVENLVTITGYSGADPEIGAIVDENGNTNSFDVGIDRGIYPLSRIFRFGTTISF